METSSEAQVGIFKIGPTTALGRTIAIRVLVCKSVGELRKAIEILVGRQWRQWRGILRWINPRKPHVILAVVVFLALWLRRRGPAVRAQARLAYRRKYWRNLMATAVTYDEWSHAAKMLDMLTPRLNDSELYDEDLVRNKLRELIHRRQQGGVRDIIFCLRADLVRNLGNMCNPRLHKGRLQVPKLIKEYIDEVSTQLRLVCDWDSEELSLEEKLTFMHETRHSFGRTALLLSGGSSLGAFHVGVVKTLVENRLLPRVIAGSSVGSIMCSIIGTRTWPELQSFFEDSTPSFQFFDNLGGVFAIVRRVMSLGAVHEIRQLQMMLRKLTSNMTFQEAYDLTGRVLGITVCSPRRHEPPRLLNYLTSPHVVIWSAVTASCAFPGLFQAQELLAKDRNGELVPYHTPFQVGPDESAASSGVRQWRDGSLESDLPMMQLKELFNVNHFIVSQANPHIAPLLRLKEFVRQHGGEFAAKLAHLAEMEVKHRCNQILELGFPLGGIAKLFAQEWEGDVTVVMPATLAQFAKLIQNPSPVELQKAVNQGRRCTWEKLSAIKANCGIELVLDECVSFLNHMRRVKRNAERAASQGMGNVKRFNASMRIPSWNRMERESSWGSLDDETLTAEYASRPGGPWGGPSRRYLRSPHNPHDGSDSESENSIDIGASWTRIGGPLMRTVSAIKFAQSLEPDMELNKHEIHREEIQNPAGNNPYVSRTSPREHLCNDCGMQKKQSLERSSDVSTANDGDIENNCCSSSETRIWGSNVSGTVSRLAVAEGDFLQPEKSPVGIVFNVVKRKDIAVVNTDCGIGFCQDEQDCIDNDHPDSPGKDSDEINIHIDSECQKSEQICIAAKEVVSESSTLVLAMESHLAKASEIPRRESKSDLLSTQDNVKTDNLSSPSTTLSENEYLKRTAETKVDSSDGSTQRNEGEHIVADDDGFVDKTISAVDNNYGA